MTDDTAPSKNIFADAETPQQLLGELAGAASTCWQHLDRAGVFDSEQATIFVDHALDRLIELGWDKEKS